ncbi:dATP/dGTP pyrophosphohydrolase domain-containing protein [Enterobacter asburiae]|uniref:dATP/dGTP pyrophosphohydrolase domain-containing protein n=1 Tax=Enterobacter asburiae TaxID=61645 RepID=UPI001F14ECBA|nr:dATP/dGTP pyrophosphohydrolase domain-containing protein [Enterobacter asburiae]
MSTITKERVAGIASGEKCYTHDDVVELARIALASLETEPVAWAHRLINKRNGVVHPWVYGSAEACPSEGDIFNIEVMPLYTAPPAPISVPAAMEMDDDFDSSFEHGKAVGWNAYRAAMLQGDEPVSNRDELRVKVRREHAEWSQATFGDVGPVGPLKHLSKEALEAAAEPGDLSEWADMQFLLWDAQRRAGISDGEITAAMEEKLKVNMARQWPEPKDGEPRLHIKTSGNSPVIPDGWVACSEQMPEQFKAILAFNEYGEVWSGAYDRYWNFYCDNLLVEHVTHWMPLPAAPQQEVNNG